MGVTTFGYRWDGQGTVPNPAMQRDSGMSMNQAPSNRILTPSLIMIGLGAGFVSAVLSAVIATGRPAALILFFLAPLPIVIAALGWNHRAGLIAAIAGAIVLGLIANPWAALIFAISTALPAWWFSFLALLARRDEALGQTEWYPLGRLLLWIAGLVAMLTIAGLLSISTDYASYVKSFERVIPLMERFNPGIFEGLNEAQRQARSESLAQAFAWLAPAVSAAISVATTVLLLYLGARAVQSSGRLPRPWPAIPETTMPRVALLALAVTALGSLLGGFVGVACLTAAAALGMAFSLQGLATIHALTRSMNGRGALLTGLYVLLVIFGGWPIFVIALTGIIEAVFGLRARQNGRIQPPT